MNAPDAAHSRRNSLLARLFENNRQELCQYLRARYGAGPPDPEDAVQAAFLKLSQLEDVHRLRNPRAFLYRVARNALIDGRRRHQTRQRHLEADNVNPAPQSGADCDPVRVLQGKQDVSALELAIMGLETRERDFLLLFRLHGLSYSEIARRSGMSRNGVKAVIARALGACEQAMAAPQPASDRSQ